MKNKRQKQAFLPFLSTPYPNVKAADMATNKLVLGCDDAAVAFKKTMVDFLCGKGYEVEDVGVDSESDHTPYAEVAERVAHLILASGGQKRGILFCGTGIGMAISANKVPGIRAAQVHDIFSAERAALSNDANVITMGSRIITPELAKRLVMEWLPLEFQPGPSSGKIQAILDIEREYAREGGPAKPLKTR